MFDQAWEVLNVRLLKRNVFIFVLACVALAILACGRPADKLCAGRPGGPAARLCTGGVGPPRGRARVNASTSSTPP